MTTATYSLAFDGEMPGIATFNAIVEANEDDADLLAAIAGLVIGETYLGGGGAAPTFTVTRLA